MRLAILAMLALAGIVQGQNVIGKAATLGRIDGRGNSLPESLYNSCVFWQAFPYDDALTSYDYSRSNNNVSATNTSTLASWSAAGRTFDGINDYYIGPAIFSSLDYVQQFSICAWVRPTETNKNKGVVAWSAGGDLDGYSKSSGGQLRIISNNYLRCVTTGPIGSAPQYFFDSTTYRVPASLWTFLCVTLNHAATNMALYANATNIASSRTVSIAGIPTNTCQFPVQVGSVVISTGRTGYFVGDIGTVWLFNRIITGDEMTNLFNRTKGRYGL